LQEFLELADLATQKEILGQKAQHLYMMSVNVPREVMELWMAYQQTLESYLQRRTNVTQPTLRSDPEQRLQGLMRATVKRLNELDAARAALKGESAEAGAEGDVNRQARR
jgi:hypothetical protein